MDIKFSITGNSGLNVVIEEHWDGISTYNMKNLFMRILRFYWIEVRDGDFNEEYSN